MAKQNRIYRCKLCGNTIEVIFNGSGTLICCGTPMSLVKPNANEAEQKFYNPVTKKIDDAVKVYDETINKKNKKGYVSFIVVRNENTTYRKVVEPDKEITAKFKMFSEGEYNSEIYTLKVTAFDKMKGNILI